MMKRKLLTLFIIFFSIIFSLYAITPSYAVDEDSQLDDETIEDEDIGDDDLGGEDLGDEDIGDDSLGDEDIGDDNLGDEDIGDDDLGDENTGDDDLGYGDTGDDLSDEGENVGDDDLGNDNSGGQDSSDVSGSSGTNYINVTSIPHTGIGSYLILFILLLISAIVSFINMKKYKNI